MSLFDQASILITPNAVKAGKLYSIKPTDGSGDLSVVRATSATIPKNAQGLVEVPRTNLVLQSQTFENAYWGKDAGFVVTANSTIAPDGSLTADKLDISASTGALFRSGNTVVSNSSYTSSIYIKAEGTNIGRTITFEITPTLVRNTIILTGEWQRITANTTASTTALNFVIRKLITDTADSFFIWGAQLEAGVTATEYIPTIASIRTKFAGITQDGGSASNIARLDYTNGSCPSILVEPQRTNLATYSEDFTNSSWNKITSGESVSTPIVTANSAISPDGTMNADLIEFTPPSDSNYSICKKIISFNNSLSGSIYLKAFDESQVGKKVSVNIFAGNVQGTVLTLTNEWQKVIISRPTDAYLEFTFGKGRTTWITGGITQSESASKFYAWGAQLEVGANATSYIPTVASAVTRNADVISKTGISDLIGQSEGTIFVDLFSEFSLQSKDFSVSDGTLNNRITLGYANVSETRFSVQVVKNGTLQVNNSFITIDQNIRNKIAFSYKENDFKLFVNGILIFTDNLGETFNTDVLNTFLLNRANGQNPYTGEINLLALFKTALTDQECIAMTQL